MMTVYLAAFCLGFGILSVSGGNVRPIIGVWAQDSFRPILHFGDSYLQSDYVKYLEQAGSQVVPIKINEKQSYYEDLFNQINGALFPGGAVNLATSKFARAAKIFYQLALKANRKGDYFPLWGTCMGFQLLSNLTAGVNVLQKCKGENILMPLDLVPDYRSSHLFGSLPNDIIELVSKWRVTANFHNYCLTEKTFYATKKLKSFYRVLSSNKDADGLKFISTMEAYDYPFYGVQWHPEKNNFEWAAEKHLNHSWGAVKVSQQFANFFVNEARKSNHRFPSLKEEAAALINNYQTVFTGPPSFQSIYFFNFTTTKNVKDKKLAHKRRF